MLDLEYDDTIEPSHGHWRRLERDCTLIGTGAAEAAARATVTEDEAQSLATKTQYARTQTEADDAHFALLFKKLGEMVNPGNIDFAAPFRELDSLAKVIKANCLPDEHAESQLIVDGIFKTEQLTGEYKTKMALLQLKVKRLSEESAKVSAHITATAKGLDEFAGKPAGEAADVKVHLNRLHDLAKDAADALTRAQTHLKNEASTIEARRKEFEAAQQKLEGHKAQLKEFEKSLKNLRPNGYMVGIGRGSTAAYSTQKYILAQDIKRLDTQVKSQEAILEPIKNLYETAAKDKSTYDGFVKAFVDEQKSLEGYITRTDKFYKDAEKWRDVFAVFQKEWHLTDSQVGTVVHGSTQLQADLDRFLPQCAIFSKHVLNVVDRGSFFGNRGDLMPLLLAAVQNLEAANNLTGPDAAMHELKIGIENERRHLLEVKKLLAEGHYQDHETPQPLGLEALYKKG